MKNKLYEDLKKNESLNFIDIKTYIKRAIKEFIRGEQKILKWDREDKEAMRKEYQALLEKWELE